MENRGVIFVLGRNGVMEPKQQVEQAPKQQQEKSWITDASFLVPLAIVIAYMWVLSQTFGYYNYFSVPGNFISLNPTTVLGESRPYYILLAFLLSLLYMGRVVVRFLEEVSTNNPAHGLYLFMALAALPMLMIFYSAYRYGYLLSSISSAIFILIFICALVFKKTLIAQRERIQERRQASGLSIVRYWNDLVILVVLIAVGVGCPLLFYSGKHLAEKKKMFYVIKKTVEGVEDKEFIFLGNYGDYLLTVPFKRGTKISRRKVVLLKMSDDRTPLSLSLEEVGQLKPEETKPVEIKQLP
jgi:hypothetical protein